ALSGPVALAGLVAFLVLLARGDPALLATGGSYGLGLLVMALAAASAIPLHELAHAVALKAGGGEVGQGGFLLHHGLPSFYVDTSDAWLGGRGLRLRVSW